MYNSSLDMGPLPLSKITKKKQKKKHHYHHNKKPYNETVMEILTVSKSE